MKKVGGYFHTLYYREEPHTPDLLLETNINLYKVNDEIPSEAEVDQLVPEPYY